MVCTQYIIEKKTYFNGEKLSYCLPSTQDSGKILLSKIHVSLWDWLVVSQSVQGSYNFSSKFPIVKSFLVRTKLNMVDVLFNNNVLKIFSSFILESRHFN